MAQAPTANDRKRVKVYELKSNDWFDRGTGFCAGAFIEDEARIHVQSEDDPSRTLLETKISKDDGYQKQQDTLIVWTEPNGTDMALSFQEAEGCGAIWEFVSEMQQRLGDDGMSDEALENIHTILLPQPELTNLADIEGMMRMANNSAMGRDALTKFVLSSEYVAKVVPLVKMAEDNEDVTSLHKLCNIMKTLILLNDNAIIETVVMDELILGVVGALEYDPDFPSHKANHRQYLSDGSKFKEVIKIEDELVKRKIHFTYRLQYLKDVVLARILDDPTFSVLNSLIYFNQIDIIQHLQNHLDFFRKLFGLFASSNTDESKKRDAVLFIQTVCAIAKSLQAQQKVQLYQNLISCGLLMVITFALGHHDASVRVAGTDILVALIDHDSLLVRGQIFKALNEGSKPLTDIMIELLLVEVDLGVKSQMADATRILLDPNVNPGSFEGMMGRGGNEYVLKMRPANGGTAASQTDAFIASFYEQSARKLFQPLQDLQHRESMENFSAEDVNLHTYLVDLLSFFVRQHAYRSKQFVFEEHLLARVAQLMRCPEKHLKLISLKFFRTCLGLHDEGYNNQIMSDRIFDPILDIMFETMPRDNLLNSACLELFEFVKKENIKSIIAHLTETYRERLEQITYVDTFENLIAKYEQQKHAAEHPVQLDPNASYSSADTEPVSTSGRIVNGGRWQGLRDADAEEEAYFNGEEAEEDGGLGAPGSANGGSVQNHSPVHSLVDYPDDDEDTMDVLATVHASSAPQARQDTVANAPNGELLFEGLLEAGKSDQTAEADVRDLEVVIKEDKQAPTPPPERTAEKRRREEEDDDDELAKLSGTDTHHVKRRSSNASMISLRSNVSVTEADPNKENEDHKSIDGSSPGSSAQQTHFLRRKRAMHPSREGTGMTKKISISLGSKVTDTGGNGKPAPVRDGKESAETSAEKDGS